jgi:hypothetical protein
MAWSQGQLYTVVVQGVDINGHKARTGFYILSAGLAFEDARAHAENIVDAMIPISGMSIRSFTVSQATFETEPGAATQQGEDKALFVFWDALSPPTAVIMNVPGCKGTIMQPNLTDIDLTNADVLAFTNAIIDADVGTGAHVVSAARGDVVEVEKAYLSQRRSLLRPSRRAG